MSAKISHISWIPVVFASNSRINLVLLPTSLIVLEQVLHCSQSQGCYINILHVVIQIDIVQNWK